eukprot:13315-Rhodomonas_salina.1
MTATQMYEVRFRPHPEMKLAISTTSPNCTRANTQSLCNLYQECSLRRVRFHSVLSASFFAGSCAQSCGSVRCDTAKSITIPVMGQLRHIVSTNKEQVSQRGRNQSKSIEINRNQPPSQYSLHQNLG